MALQQSMTPTEVAERIGREYVERESLPGEGTDEIADVYDRIADRIGELFGTIPYPVCYQSRDPYGDYYEMKERVKDEKVLRIYGDHTDHPHFRPKENLQFRAVHDWHGHLAADVDFTPEGEFKKWLHMKDWFETNEQKSVMFAEVVGQVGAVHYLENGFEDDRFEQRAFVAPIEWIEEMDRAVR